MLRDKLPRTRDWRASRPPADFMQSITTIMQNPDPRLLGFKAAPIAGSPAVMASAPAGDGRVVFLATDDMYKNCFTIFLAMAATYTSWGILTNGVVWRLYNDTVFSPLEDYFEVNAPEAFKIGTPEYVKYCFFTAAAVATAPDVALHLGLSRQF